MTKKKEQTEVTLWRCPVEDCKKEGIKTLASVSGHLRKIRRHTLKDFPDAKETCSRVVLSPGKIIIFKPLKPLIYLLRKSLNRSSLLPERNIQENS